MPGRNIIVIGASAGGVDALSKLFERLPADLPASIFVVVHVPPLRTSFLPEIITRRGKLPAAHPADGELFEQGRVYVAPPGMHMTIEHDRISLTAKAKENGHRPAVDPLFRSAARYHGARVVGVILSGTMDDGTAGAVAVSRCGGITIAQDPEEASFSGMPASAIKNDHTRLVLPVAQIADEIVRLANAPIDRKLLESEELRINCAQQMEILAVIDKHQPHTEDVPGILPSVFTCPECHGTLFETRESNMHYRCRVGHAYAPDSLLSHQSGSVEAALWTAVRTLEESAALSRRLADRAQQEGRIRSAVQFSEHVSSTEQHARIIRELLLGDQLQTTPDEGSFSSEDAEVNEPKDAVMKQGSGKNGSA